MTAVWSLCVTSIKISDHHNETACMRYQHADIAPAAVMAFVLTIIV